MVYTDFEGLHDGGAFEVDSCDIFHDCVMSVSELICLDLYLISPFSHSPIPSFLPFLHHCCLCLLCFGLY